MSSSCAKPCAHHISMVFACALALCGQASAPTAIRPKESRMSERRVSLAMVVSFPVHARPRVGGLVYSVRQEERPITEASQCLPGRGRTILPVEERQGACG